MRYNIFILSAVCCLFLLLSGCAQHANNYTIYLVDKADFRNARILNKDISVNIVDGVKNSNSVIGGDDCYRNINFKSIAPWIESSLTSINELDLKHKIYLTISLKKLYVETDSTVPFTVLVLNAKFNTRDGKFISRNYREDCKVGFFYSAYEKGIRACLNKSLDRIINDIRYDIYRLSNK